MPQPQPSPTERRREPRLPFADKVIFTDGVRSSTARAANISHGGMFVVTLNPFPIETTGFLAFVLPGNTKSLCIKAKVTHIVFDKQRCEIDCGMGFQFVNLHSSQQKTLADFLSNERAAYLELKEILSSPRPDPKAINRIIKRFPVLPEGDLMAIRYRVDRICTLFDTFR